MSHYAAAAKPDHVAIIMDGNGRWANGRGLRRVMGHRKGAEAVRVSVDAARDSGIGYLTLFAFSSENWKRPEDEVNDIMGLIGLFVDRELENYHRQNLRFRMIGERSGLSESVVKSLEKAEKRTESNTGLNVIVAVNYGARAEIAKAVSALAQSVKDGLLKPEEITEAHIARRLDTAGIPDPDLIIRTSGEQRLSNFLLWQAAYSEFVFLPCLWPDFSREMFFDALETYSVRCRRYGGVEEHVKALAGS
ncbi:isoprenyl transferase [Martelella mediterranea]|uniref:Isoprenyl transferase n=1 Tax=Martelella mediterranea TaxID=293089 RepID=A0A4R3NT02_9HYPH|nr:isoprenyl transferase [Martelella mediterranea]TCT40381.1 undecaprenyl diphosphate synthase [Martelella mediterranea]